jgi:hypothetical protein
MQQELSKKCSFTGIHCADQLPAGALSSIYVYRVTENGKTTLTGKVVKE